MIETKVFEPKTQVEMQKSKRGCSGDAALLFGGCLGIIVLGVVFIALLVKLFVWIV